MRSDFPKGSAEEKQRANLISDGTWGIQGGDARHRGKTAAAKQLNKALRMPDANLLQPPAPGGRGRRVNIYLFIALSGDSSTNPSVNIAHRRVVITRACRAPGMFSKRASEMARSGAWDRRLVRGELILANVCRSATRGKVGNLKMDTSKEKSSEFPQSRQPADGVKRERGSRRGNRVGAETQEW